MIIRAFNIHVFNCISKILNQEHELTFILNQILDRGINCRREFKARWLQPDVRLKYDEWAVGLNGIEFHAAESTYARASFTVEGCCRLIP